jgi:hypothetical protein
MAEETAVAESSAAAATETAAPKFTQFDGWDEDGNPVVQKKPESPRAAMAARPDKADAAAADTSKETKSDDAADSAAKSKQETHRKPGAEDRIKELIAKNKKLETDLEEARKPKETKAADSSTAKPEAKPAPAPVTRPKPAQADKTADGKAKYATYEEFIEDLSDWKAEQRIEGLKREQQVAQQRQTLGRQLEEARGRYADFDTVTKPLITEMLKPDIPPAVFAVINDSPVLADLLYTLGGTEATKADFLDACRTNPGKALRVALLVEQEVTKELAKGKGGAGGAGKKEGEGEGESTPAAKQPRAPKPPTEVGGRGAPGEDALVSASKAGDFRAFDAEQTRRAVASRR